jgi:hypothetical protein
MIDHAAAMHSVLAVIEDSGIVWGRFDHKKSGVIAADWAVIVGGTCLLVIAILFSYWRSRRQKSVFLRNSSLQMFNELSRAHRIDRARRRLLKKLAEAGGAENACKLFVEPECFSAAKIPPSANLAAAELRQLRHELFE